jgi:hypothetical protein
MIYRRRALNMPSTPHKLTERTPKPKERPDVARIPALPAISHGISQPPCSREALDPRLVRRARSLAGHSWCDVLHEALHRLEELIKVAVAVEINLEAVEACFFAVA